MRSVRSKKLAEMFDRFLWENRLTATTVADNCRISAATFNSFRTRGYVSPITRDRFLEVYPQPNAAEWLEALDEDRDLVPV